MKEIFKILENYKLVKREFYYFLLSGVLMEITYVISPLFVKKIIEIIEKGGNIKDLYLICLYLGLFSVFAIITILIWDYFNQKIWSRLYPKKKDIYRKILFKLDYDSIIREGTGKLISKLNMGTEAEVQIFISIINILVNAIFRGLLVIIILGYYLPKLLIIVFIAIIIIFILNHYLSKYISPITEKEQDLWEKDGRIGAKIIMENLTIKLFGKKDSELKKANKNLKETFIYGDKVYFVNNLYYKILELILRFVELGFFIIIGGAILLNKEYSIAYLIMLTSYVWFLWWPLDKAIVSINQINKVWEKYIKLRNFIEKPNDIKNGTKKYNYIKGEIDFKNIDFHYNKEREIFKDLNIKFLAGKKNAIIGHSGGGKSTITKILLRLYDYSYGKLTIDGQELKNLEIETFYKHIGYLPQEPAIFDGTIRENLEYAFDDNAKYDDKILWDSLKDALIDDMIKGLKDGLETEVGEKGIKLSGGEKQRLAIARIFLKNPEIIILDEPTSALDSISEHKITKSLNNLIKGKTSIIIAHRLQTVMNSDNIIIIEKGEVKATGKHKKLLKTNETYKTLVDLQNGKIIE